MYIYIYIYNTYTYTFTYHIAGRIGARGGADGHAAGDRPLAARPGRILS